MSIVKSTKLYETWVRSLITIVQADLDVKHQAMADDEFVFLRGTFYRWAQTFPTLCAELCDAPVVLSVGDLHVEQYSTWRDDEARLNLGIADFDEGYPLPYTNDLVRLATSACKAIDQGNLRITKALACASILKGYKDCIACGGKPFVLEEEYPELRAMAIARLAVPSHYWQKLDLQLKPTRLVPADAKAALEGILPDPKLPYRTYSRRAGVGSLGRQRFVAVAQHHGARIAREAKATLPSACAWAQNVKNPKSMLNSVLQTAIRSKDPFLKTDGAWVVRRLSPSCSRMELSSLPKVRDEARLLWAMGFDAGNVHVGSKAAVAAIKRDLQKRSPTWLRKYADVMSAAIRADFKDWREHHLSK